MTKLSEQQEKFCRNVVEGMSQTEAYLRAGYNCKPKDARCHASALVTKHNIAIRIEQLRKQATESTEITLQWLLKEVAETYRAAREEDAHAPAVAALREIGVLTGHRIEKQHRENDNFNYEVSDAPLDADAWEKEFAESDSMEAAAGASARLN